MMPAIAMVKEIASTVWCDRKSARWMAETAMRISHAAATVAVLPQPAGRIARNPSSRLEVAIGRVVVANSVIQEASLSQLLLGQKSSYSVVPGGAASRAAVRPAVS